MFNIFTRNDLDSIKDDGKENISPEARSDYDYLTNHEYSHDTSHFHNSPSLDDLHIPGGLGDLNLEKYLFAIVVISKKGENSYFQFIVR